MWSTVKRKLAVVRNAVDGSPDKAHHSPSASSPVAVRTPNPSTTSAVRGAQLSSTQRLISTFFTAGDTGSSGPVPLSQRSAKELKTLIVAAGLSHQDCVEKSDLVRRATEATPDLARPSLPAVPKSPKDDEFAMSPGDERLFEEASAPGALERARREAARRRGWAQADAELAGAYGGAAR